MSYFLIFSNEDKNVIGKTVVYNELWMKERQCSY